MKKIVNLTQAGKAELERELQELIAERPAIAERIAIARDFGDLKENEEYAAARAEQRQAENRILELEEIIKNAKIIKNTTSSKVTIGTSVTIELAGKTQTYSLVGPVEADPLSGRISDQSPIGKALLGLKVGDNFKLPNGNTGKILSLN